MDQEYCDLTEEEVESLPLPDGWISLIKIPLATSSTLEQKPIRTYKNVRLGIESQEHPFMVQAQNKVKKINAPEPWIVKDVDLSDGTKDYFYYNPELELSMWDHPLLRDELCEILNKSGHNANSLGIKIEPKIIYPVSQPELQSLSSVRDVVEQPSVLSFSSSKKTDKPSISEHGSIKIRQSIQSQQLTPDQLINNLAHSGHSSIGISEYDRSINSSGESNVEEIESKSYNHSEEEQEEQDVSMVESENSVDDQTDMLYMDELGEQRSSTAAQEESSHQSNEHHAFPPDPSIVDEIAHENHRDWESLLNTYKNPGSELDKISHRVEHIRPPVSISGIRVLREDVMEANQRVHQLLLRLRSILSIKSGVECSVLYHQDAIKSDTITTTSPTKLIQNNVTLASDIVTALRQQPEFIVLAMANSNNLRDGSIVMVQIAYTVLHRLLHPFSTDSSMTTAVLLQGINYQLDELTTVEQVFSVLDSKVIIARALFIADPEIAVTWDPLSCPLPTIPGTHTETVLACLLRTYAIRRDVTSYYRTIWKPIIPGVVALLKQHTGSSSSSSSSSDKNNHISIESQQQSREHMFANTMAVAIRLLECTLHDKSILIFPNIATAVCRALHEIGGKLALHTYLFQLLILPNLLKILAGDHDSTENEDIYRIHNITEIMNKYYDHTFWYKSSNETIQDPNLTQAEEVGILDPLKLLIWLIWRLYTCSIFMSEKTITAINMNIFIIKSTIPINLNIYKDIYKYSTIKLRNILTRLRKKIDLSCLFLFKMPMDLQGSEYLSVNKLYEEDKLNHYIKKISISTELTQELMHLYDHRMHSLYFKPNEMLNLTIISKYEIVSLFTDIALAMEMHDQVGKTPIYNAIVEYLNTTSSSTNTSGSNNNGTSSGNCEENKEELIELSFLYMTDDFNGYNINDMITTTNGATSCTGNSSNDEEKTNHAINHASSELNDLIVSRYNQLLRGLKLCNRYEDILIRILQRNENDQISNIFELIEEEFWFSNNESNPIHNNNNNQHQHHHNNLANKHTIGTINKRKTSHYGLVQSLPIPVFPLFSNSTATSTSKKISTTSYEEIIKNKSLMEIQKEIINSYRFHTSAPSANAGTSLGRSKVLQPKINPNHINLNTNTSSSSSVNKASNSSRSNYTKVQINPKSGILAPTQNIINHNNPILDNPQQKHHKFLKSLRDHNIIPTHEFQKRYQNIILERKKNKKELLEKEMLSEHNHQYNNNNVMNTNNRILQPFPEHLQRRVYGTTTAEVIPHAHSYKQRGRTHSSTRTTAAPVARGRSRHRNTSPHATRNASQWHQDHSDDAYYSGTDTPQSIAQEIIRDYENLFSPAVENQYTNNNNIYNNIEGNIQDRPEFMYTSMDSHHRSVSPAGSSRSGHRRTRSRSPGLPEPISPQSHFQAPTQALLHRLTDNSEHVVRDACELRRYENSSGLEIEEAFSPTAKKFYPPQGLRVNRVPDFLYNEEISDYSRSMSRSRSRSNSFTSLSPVRGRSRNNSFSNLTHICRRPLEEDTYHHQQQQQQQYEEEEEEYLPIDEPETPIQSARILPNTVNVDFIQVRQQQDDSRHHDAAVPNTYIQSNEALSALQKLRKVNVTSVDLKEAAAARAGGVNQEFAPTARRDLPSADSPYVAMLKPLNKRRNEHTNVPSDGSMNALQPTPSTAHTTEPPPVLVIHSATAAPLGGPAFASSQDHYTAPVNTSAAPVGSSVNQANAFSKPEEVQAAPFVANKIASKTANNAIPRPETVTLKPTEPPQTASSTAPPSVGVPDRPAVGYQYSIQFPSRTESNISSITGAAAGPVGADSPAHVYDVNAAYEEAFERAYQRIHRGDAITDDEAEGEYSPEDDIQSLGYVDSSKHSGKQRGSFRSGLMSKAKSMSTRASKVFLNDQQLLALLSEGFQAIKHGRSGKSKAKIVRFNRAKRLIEWESHNPDRLKALKDFCRRGSFNDIISSATTGTGTTEELSSAIRIDSIESVYTGVRTDVFLRVGHVDPACCISIVTKQRSLDLTLPNATEKDRILRGLRIILEGKNVPFL